MYVEYCLLWIDWWATCLTKDEWSSWVQALGSLFALAIAIAIPVGMHMRERAQRRTEEEATALIVAVGVHAAMGPLVGAARSVHAGMRKYAPDNDKPNIGQAIQIFDTVQFPTEWQILQIERVTREVAIALARGVGFTRQVNPAVGMFEGKTVTAKTRENVAKLHTVLGVGVAQLERAQSLLEPLLIVERLDGAEVQEMVASARKFSGA